MRIALIKNARQRNELFDNKIMWKEVFFKVVPSPAFQNGRNKYSDIK